MRNCKEHFRKECTISHESAPTFVKTQECNDGSEDCDYDINSVAVEKPVESCILVPGKSCSTETKLLPSLEAAEECIKVPKEICTSVRRNPRTVRTPVVKRVCLEGDAAQEAVRDCSDLLRLGLTTRDDIEGVHAFQFVPGPQGRRVPVRCDPDGWTIIQTRGQFGNRINYFKRSWRAYKRGFGNPSICP